MSIKETIGKVFKNVKDYDLEDIEVQKRGMGNKQFLVNYKLKNVLYGDKTYDFDLVILIGNAIMCGTQPIKLDARDKLIQCIQDFTKKNRRAKRLIKEQIEEIEKNNIINSYLTTEEIKKNSVINSYLNDK